MTVCACSFLPRTGSIVHGCFRDLPRILAAGDLLVVNTSATLPAAVPATRSDGTQLELRLSTPAPGREPDTHWIVELRHGDQPFGAVTAGDELALPAGATARIVAAYAAPRLWVARLDLQQTVATYLAEHGHPIRYRHVPRLAPRRLSNRLRRGARERRDAQRGAPVHDPADHPACHKWRSCRADHAAHRRLVAGTPRTAVPRALPRPAAHGEPRGAPCTGGAAA